MSDPTITIIHENMTTRIESRTNHFRFVIEPNGGRRLQQQFQITEWTGEDSCFSPGTMRMEWRDVPEVNAADLAEEAGR